MLSPAAARQLQETSISVASRAETLWIRLLTEMPRGSTCAGCGQMEKQAAAADGPRPTKTWGELQRCMHPWGGGAGIPSAAYHRRVVCRGGDSACTARGPA